MVYIFLADGFEETEALIPLDILRRGGVEVKTVGVTGKTVTGAHNISVTADLAAEETDKNSIEAIILPGGMPGTLNLEKSSLVQDFIDYAARENLLICAICAAPSILGHKGLTKGKTAVCYPGMEAHLEGAIIGNTLSVTDGNLITGKGPGAAAPFGFAILEKLKGKETSLKVQNEMCFKG